MFGVVKQISGNIKVRDKSGFEKKLLLDDFINFGDVIISSDKSSVLVDFCGKILSVKDGNVLKIDQSIIYDESFGDSNLSVDSLHNGLKIIENFYNLDELGFIEEFRTFDYYDIDFNSYELKIADVNIDENDKNTNN